MNIPKTTHKKVKYRNGEFGLLLCTDRKETVFKIMTLRDKNDSVIHHLESGGCLMSKEEYDWDIVEVFE